MEDDVQQNRPDVDFFERIPHTADIGIRVRGEDLEGLFANAARAMFRLMVEESPVQGPPSRAGGAGAEESVRIAADDLPSLLQAWLSELLYRFTVEGRVYTGFRIDALLGPLRGDGPAYTLEALARGERYDPARHALQTELKAVTYHQLNVEKHGDHWEAQVIFDV